MHLKETSPPWKWLCSVSTLSCLPLHEKGLKSKGDYLHMRSLCTPCPRKQKSHCPVKCYMPVTSKKDVIQAGLLACMVIINVGINAHLNLLNDWEVKEIGWCPSNWNNLYLAGNSFLPRCFLLDSAHTPHCRNNLSDCSLAPTSSQPTRERALVLKSRSWVSIAPPDTSLWKCPKLPG